MADRRVGITGLGAITAAGLGTEAFWNALLAGQSCIGPIGLFDASGYPATVAGEVRDFSARKFVPKDYRKAIKVMARDIELAVAAADLAFRDAGIVTRAGDGQMSIESTRLGCNIGAGLICCNLDELAAAAVTATVDGAFDIRAWGQRGLENLTPLWLLKYLPNMLSCHVAIIHGAEGPSNCITCGDAAAYLAVGESAHHIADGIIDAAVAGAAESKLNPLSVLRQALLKRLVTDRNGSAACRPFDARHAGTVIGEGGGLLILEEMDRAKARGATIYADLVGFGAACDPAGMDLTRPTVGSLHLAAQQALDDAGVAADQVDLIVTHGTGVPDEDRLEAAAWKEVLGQAAGSAAAMAVTGTIGSLFAAAGGAELIAAAMALHTQTVPPTANFTQPADGCELKFATAAEPRHMTYALSGAFTVSGQSAACLLKRVEP